MTDKTLIEKLLKNDRYALSKVLSEVDNDTVVGIKALDELYPHTGKAWIVGITGSPGTGKSTLVNSLALQLSKRGQKVAILAIDPSSPFSGGSILGDRVRMRDLYGKPNIFIRSLSSKGRLGGISRSTFRMARVFDAAGFDIVIIETVGIGQNEIEVSKLAHTTIVVEAPGFGDEIQAIKAGILEIADIVVVNKSDLPGAEATVSALYGMINYGFKLHESEETNGWVPPVLRTSSLNGKGFTELINELDKHKDHLLGNQIISELESLAVVYEIREEVEKWIREHLFDPSKNPELASLITRVINREISPQEASRQITDKINF